MFALALFAQDLIVTALAALALLVLVWRMVGVVRPAPGESACNACSSCAPAASQPQGQTTVVPLSSLRREPHASRSPVRS